MAETALGQLLPGQDLLAQARAGLMWLNGDRDQPRPLRPRDRRSTRGKRRRSGRARRARATGPDGRGRPCRDQPSRGLVDFQFEVLTTYSANGDGGRMPARSGFRNAHAYLAAPYGVYPTSDGWLAIAMTPLDKLAGALDLPAIAGLPQSAGFERRDEIKRLIADHISSRPTSYWLNRMQPADIWSAEVLDWPALFVSQAFKQMDILQTVFRPDGQAVRTTRLPLRVDGRREDCRCAAPSIGAHTAALRAEMGIPVRSDIEAARDPARLTR